MRTQTAAPLDADNGSVAAVAQALLPSTVQIVAELDGRAGGATGSGFVLDREGHVVTNNHVVASAAADDGPIVVIDHEGERHEATVVGRSAVYDLAVLDVDGAESLEPAALGASQVLRVGDSVIAFGAPLGLSQTVTSGIVSALNRPVTTSGESDDESSYINAVQTDAAINPGNSGGPLVNLAGEVVGVNSAIATTGGATSESGNIGVGFAIPIEQVRTTVDQILRTGKAEYPVIGAQVRTGGEPDATGATITEVMADTPAERAGLKKDDVITAVDDLPVNDGIALIVAIRTHLPGETVEMSVRARRRGAGRRGRARRQGRLRPASRLGQSAGAGARLGLHERVLVDERPGLGVHPLDELLELGPLDAPLAAPADLDRRQVAAPDQGVDLRAGGVEHLGDVGERQEAGVVGHGAIVPPTRAPRDARPARPCGETGVKSRP